MCGVAERQIETCSGRRWSSTELWNKRNITCVLVAVLAFTCLVAIFSLSPLPANDWVQYFRPAALHPLSPYSPGVYNPPWSFVFLHPIARLPSQVGIGVLYAVSLVLVALYVKTPGRLLVVMLAAPIWGLLWYGQLDALVLLGLMLPPEVCLPVLAIKPQSAFVAALPRLSRRSLGFLGVWLIGSFVVWGIWPKNIQPIGEGLNASLFPYSVPCGLALLYFYWRKRLKSDALLCLASLCLSPYWQFHSLLPTVAAAAKETKRGWQWVMIIVGSWVYVFVMRRLEI